MDKKIVSRKCCHEHYSQTKRNENRARLKKQPEHIRQTMHYAPMQKLKNDQFHELWHGVGQKKNETGTCKLYASWLSKMFYWSINLCCRSNLHSFVVCCIGNFKIYCERLLESVLNDIFDLIERNCCEMIEIEVLVNGWHLIDVLLQWNFNLFMFACRRFWKEFHCEMHIAQHIYQRHWFKMFINSFQMMNNFKKILN